MMEFFVGLTDSASEDLDYFRKSERKIISDGMDLFLRHDANVETRTWQGEGRCCRAEKAPRLVHPWQKGGTMKTLNLSRRRITVEELLKAASAGSVRLVTADGRSFVLEEADEFEEEVKALGKSKKFRRFLKDRSKEPATTSLDDYRRSLN